MRSPVVVVDVEYTTTAGATVRERSTLGQARRTVRMLEVRHAMLSTPLPKGTYVDDRESKAIDAARALEAYRSALHRAGYCRACGRRLTDTVSVGYGYGPDCRARLDTGDRS